MSEQEQKKVWRKFERQDGITFWVCPVTFTVLKHCNVSGVYLNDFYLGKVPIAEVATKLNIILEGVNDDAPEPKPVDYAAMLEYGNRLRYVRDTASDCVPPWDEVEAKLYQCDNPQGWFGMLHYSAPGANICTPRIRNKADVARWTHNLVTTLGYRFDRVID